jgi:hypothetical protein
MPHQCHIHGYNTQHRNSDPTLLTQILILLVLTSSSNTTHNTTTRHHRKPGVAHLELPPDETPLTPRNNTREPS